MNFDFTLSKLFASLTRRESLCSTTQSSLTEGLCIWKVSVSTLGEGANRNWINDFFKEREKIPEGLGSHLVSPLDSQLQTALVQPGHLLVLLPDGSLNLREDRCRCVCGQARIGTLKATDKSSNSGDSGKTPKLADGRRWK